MIQMEKDKVPLWNISDGVSTILPDCLEQRLVLLAYARYNFSKFFKDAESNIDTEYQFRDFFDIIRYIPRALMIGFFEPFPNRWFKEGKSAGRISRITAGLEMFVLYLLLPGFLYFVVVSKVPLQIRIWLAVLCVSLILLTSLLVTNIGALMRMRFVYLLPVLIGGLETWLRVKHLKNAV
jgi:hypothetical protein